MLGRGRGMDVQDANATHLTDMRSYEHVEITTFLANIFVKRDTFVCKKNFFDCIISRR